MKKLIIVLSIVFAGAIAHYVYASGDLVFCPSGLDAECPPGMQCYDVGGGLNVCGFSYEDALGRIGGMRQVFAYELRDHFFLSSNSTKMDINDCVKRKCYYYDHEGYCWFPL